MRTTLEIEDDVLAAARSLAHAQHRSIGAALSSLARRGLAPSVEIVPSAAGFPVFSVAPIGHPITSEVVRAAVDEEL
ncbi:MAG: antitoxin [Mycobacteriales bacterium]